MTARDPDAATQQAPVNPNERYHIEIEDLGQEGDGIGYIEGFVIIVPGTGLGDWVTVEIEAVQESFALASVVGETTINPDDTEAQ